MKYQSIKILLHLHLCASVTKQVLVKGRWRSEAGKVTVRLATHWPCVTDFVVYPPIYGRKAHVREMSTRLSSPLSMVLHFLQRSGDVAWAKLRNLKIFLFKLWNLQLTRAMRRGVIRHNKQQRFQLSEQAIWSEKKPSQGAYIIHGTNETIHPIEEINTASNHCLERLFETISDGHAVN